MIAAAGKSLAQRLFRRPFLARDRIFRAVSDDGLEWLRDESFILEGALGEPRQVYYAAQSPDRGMIFRSSLWTGKTWSTEILAGRRWSAPSPAIGNFLGFGWLQGRFYCVPTSQTRPQIRCFTSLSFDEAPEPIHQSWEKIETFEAIEDIAFAQTDGSLHAWCSCIETTGLIAIHHWVSSDGMSWTYGGRAIGSANTENHKIFNNPCVVKTDEGWRIYYRGSFVPALGSQILSSISDDLVLWSPEPGVRQAPDSKWDSHGVGFPFVSGSDRGEWEMFFTGYWGSCREGEEVAAAWRAGASGLNGAHNE